MRNETHAFIRNLRLKLRIRRIKWIRDQIYVSDPGARNLANAVRISDEIDAAHVTLSLNRALNY